MLDVLVEFPSSDGQWCVLDCSGLWELSLTEDHVKEEVKQVKDMA